MNNYLTRLLYTLISSIFVIFGTTMLFGTIQELTGFIGPQSIAGKLGLNPSSSLVLAIICFAGSYGIYRLKNSPHQENKSEKDEK